MQRVIHRPPDGHGRADRMVDGRAAARDRRRQLSGISWESSVASAQVKSSITLAVSGVRPDHRHRTDGRRATTPSAPFQRSACQLRLTVSLLVRRRNKQPSRRAMADVPVDIRHLRPCWRRPRRGCRLVGPARGVCLTPGRLASCARWNDGRARSSASVRTRSPASPWGRCAWRTRARIAMR